MKLRRHARPEMDVDAMDADQRRAFQREERRRRISRRRRLALLVLAAAGAMAAYESYLGGGKR